MIVLDGIQFKLFVKMFCHDKFLLQYDTFIVSLIDGMKSSHFDLYYLYSNTTYRYFSSKTPLITLITLIKFSLSFPTDISSK